ncbi:hypothetical protein ACA910_004900 [Epithemia clementina (nom. ined.)]
MSLKYSSNKAGGNNSSLSTSPSSSYWNWGGSSFNYSNNNNTSRNTLTNSSGINQGNINNSSSNNNNSNHGNHSSSSNNNNNNNNATWTLKCTDLPQFDALQAQADLFRTDDKLHLRNLCNNSARCAGLTAVHYSTTAFAKITRRKTTTRTTTTPTTTTTNEERTTETAAAAADNQNNAEQSTAATKEEEEEEVEEEDIPEKADSQEQINNSNTINNNNNKNNTGTTTITGATGRSMNLNNVIHRRIILDYSRQRVQGETMELLYDLADAVGLTDRREAFKQGQGINLTTSKGQPVLHFLLRRQPESSNPSTATSEGGGEGNSSSATTGAAGEATAAASKASTPASSSTTNTNTSGGGGGMALYMRQILAVRRQIADFAERVRNGTYTSVTNQPFCNTLVLCSGRGGYQSGPECIAAALELDAEAMVASAGRTLRFVACSDPTQFVRATHDLNAAETLVVLILLDYRSSSSSSSSEEVALNARTVQSWLKQNLMTNDQKATTTTTTTTTTNTITEADIIAKHIVAVACTDKFNKCQEEFGVRKENIFAVWNWVNPRYSLFSAAGLLPLALQFSMPIMEQVMEGAHDMDEHFFHAPLRDNIPVILGLLGVWNSTFLGYSSRVILPYADGLRLLPTHVQQVDMESNGKRVALDGTPLLHRSGEINVTTAPYVLQQSMFQLLHQGRAIPADFIGFMVGQAPTAVEVSSDSVSNHDELMSHFFAEPDALAYGKTLVDLIQEGTPEPLREHMVVTGNRPSSSILLTKLDAFSVGQLLAMYEHRTAVQGFLWGLNSFDQFGIELGRVLAKSVRAQLAASRKTGASVQGFNSSTSSLLEQYLTLTNYGKKQQKTNANGGGGGSGLGGLGGSFS